MAKTQPSIHIEPAPKSRALGPAQLDWCRKHLGVFATCERQALEAQAHRDAILAKVNHGAQVAQ